MNKKRIRDRRFEELIDATISAVHEKGYTLVTMSEIAKRAGATAASINYYFGSKDRLMEATMLHIMAILRDGHRQRLMDAKTPHDRLMAALDANFDDSLFTQEICSFWMQFWSNAPYFPRLSRLHRINRNRVRSHFRAELRALLPEAHRETVRIALQSYMDGVWIETAQSAQPVDAGKARKEARRVAELLVRNHA